LLEGFVETKNEERETENKFKLHYLETINDLLKEQKTKFPQKNILPGLQRNLLRDAEEFERETGSIRYLMHPRRQAHR
jgi:hypothetical protein